MKRIIQPELLDTLPPTDPRAMRSRRDLRRVNAWMRNHAIMAREIKRNVNGHMPGQISEVGAGDGNFLLRVARFLSPDWHRAKIKLLDLQANVAAETLAAYAEIGWEAEAIVADVFDEPPPHSDVVLANLFLHHFEAAQLRELLGVIAQRSRLFIAIEPRRAAWPLFCSRLLWAIGCNFVTRHDAEVSVRAGFFGAELSALWPEKTGWQLEERSAGWFSHLFVARRIS